MLVVVVQHDHGEVGVVGGDLLGRLTDADGVGEHLVAEAVEHARELVERRLILVCGEHAQAAAEILAHRAPKALLNGPLLPLPAVRPSTPPHQCRRPS